MCVCVKSHIDRIHPGKTLLIVMWYTLILRVWIFAKKLFVIISRSFELAEIYFFPGNIKSSPRRKYCHHHSWPVILWRNVVSRHNGMVTNYQRGKSMHRTLKADPLDTHLINPINPTGCHLIIFSSAVPLLHVLFQLYISIYFWFSF